DPQRHVLADEDHVVALVGEAAGYGEDAGVVVPEPEAGRQDCRVDVVELYPEGPAERPYGQLGGQAPVLDPQVVQVPQRLAGEVPQLGMVTLGFQLGDDHDREDHVMLVESRDGRWVREQDARVEDVGVTVHRVGHANSPGRMARGQRRGSDTPAPGPPGTNVSVGPGPPR